MSEWKGPWKCMKCGIVWREYQEKCSARKCGGRLVPFDRRAPDPDLLALLREAAFTLEQARQWVEGDEATHGRQYGTGNSIRSVLARIDAKLKEME